jgi:hypothetical protein
MAMPRKISSVKSPQAFISVPSHVAEASVEQSTYFRIEARVDSFAAVPTRSWLLKYVQIGDR